MEYNFLTDFLAKFSSLTPWVQGITITILAAIPISFFYYLKQIIIRTTELITINRMCQKTAMENAKSAASITENIIREALIKDNHQLL